MAHNRSSCTRFDYRGRSSSPSRYPVHWNEFCDKQAKESQHILHISESRQCWRQGQCCMFRQNRHLDRRRFGRTRCALPGSIQRSIRGVVFRRPRSTFWFRKGTVPLRTGHLPFSETRRRSNNRRSSRRQNVRFHQVDFGGRSGRASGSQRGLPQDRR